MQCYGSKEGRPVLMQSVSKVSVLASYGKKSGGVEGEEGSELW